MKLAVFSILIAFITWCGYLAYHYPGGNDNGKGLYAPNVMYRVRERVPPPISPEAVGEQQAIIAAATGWHDELQINGRRVVCTDPERHDMKHALARAEHSCTHVR